ncbi:MAG TPA: acylphosphatase [archaeon]|nr:acylphosphatase [archaeon]
MFEKIRVKIDVPGLVNNVDYKQLAVQYDIRGYAGNNLERKRVEILAMGTEENVTKFRDSLWEKFNDVNLSEMQAARFAGGSDFKIYEDIAKAKKEGLV